MKSVERSSSGGGDSIRVRQCYRCDRTVAAPRLFQIDVEPPSVFVEKYAQSVRYCCVDCAAGMNLFGFSDSWKQHAGQGKMK